MPRSTGILQHRGVALSNITGGIVQHDKATARVCRDFQQQNNVHILPWPARSADLTSIEHLCDILERSSKEPSATNATGPVLGFTSPMHHSKCGSVLSKRRSCADMIASHHVSLLRVNTEWGRLLL